MIPPRSFPVFFSTSLEPLFLASLISVLAATCTSPDAVREYIYALTRVPQFKTVVQFLSRAEQDATCAMWDTVVWGTDNTRKGDVEVGEAAHVWGVQRYGPVSVGSTILISECGHKE